MGKYFGTDGWRGVAGNDLCALDAFKIGRFLGGELKKRGGRAVIGKDTRRSSYMLEYAVASGIASAGATVYLLHVTTTACVSYIVTNEGFDLGIMISASHNPYYDNGIKILNFKGEKIGDEEIAKIEAYIDRASDTIENAQGEEIGKIIDYYEGREHYRDYLISTSKRKFSGLRVGLDASNGSAWELARDVFDALGARTYTVGCEPNGVNINHGCGSTSISALSSLVRARGLDMGFAYDGDADRCIAVDSNGDPFDGDDILYALASDLHGKGELKNSTVVATVASNLGLKKSLEALGISTIFTSVGDRFVFEEIKKGSYSLGGEESGHIIISKYARTGDGILTSIKLAELAMNNGRDLRSLSLGLKRLPQISKSVVVKSKQKVVSSVRLGEEIKKAEARLVGGRVLVRASGTEPKIRVLVEGEPRELSLEIAKSLSRVILECDENE